MRIPKSSTRTRFYVATSDSHAFSSWPTLEAARACVLAFKGCPHCESDARTIVSIVETTPTGHIHHPIPEEPKP